MELISSFPLLVPSKFQKKKWEREKYKINPPRLFYAMEISNNQPSTPTLLRPLNITWAFVGDCVCSNDHSSIYAVTIELRLRRAHIGFPDLLVEQDGLTTINTSEKTYGATGEFDVGDAERVG